MEKPPETHFKPPETLQEISSLAKKCSIQDFDYVSKLGRGSFGIVHLMFLKKNRIPLAISVIKREDMDERKIVADILLQRDLRHPHVLRMRAFFFDHEKVYIALQLAAKGSLSEHLSTKGRLSDEEASNFTAQTVKAVQYLHSRHILHMDIKPENLLLDINMKLLVANFGCSTKELEGEERETLAGTPNYMAPEQTVIPMKYTNASDCWSIGVVAYEMLAGVNPFDPIPFVTVTFKNLVKNIRNLDIKFPSFFTETAVSFIQGMLQRNPQERFTISEAGSHTWIAKYVVEEERPDPVKNESVVTENPSLDTGEKEESIEKPDKGEEHLAKAVKSAETKMMVNDMDVVPIATAEKHVSHANPPKFIAVSMGSQSNVFYLSVNAMDSFFGEIEREFRIQKEQIHLFTVNTPKLDVKSVFTGFCELSDTLYIHTSATERELVLTKKNSKSISVEGGFSLASNGFGEIIVTKVTGKRFTTKTLPKLGDKIIEIDGDSIKGLSSLQTIEILKRIPNGKEFTMKVVSVNTTKSGITGIRSKLKDRGQSKESSLERELLCAEGEFRILKNVPFREVKSINDALCKYSGVNDGAMAIRIFEETGKSSDLNEISGILNKLGFVDTNDELQKAILKAMNI